MVEPAYVLLVGAIGIQIPIGVLVYFDAKRLDLQNPETYWLGVIAPAAGFIVILYYLPERKNLPRTEPTDS